MVYDEGCGQFDRSLFHFCRLGKLKVQRSLRFLVSLVVLATIASAPAETNEPEPSARLSFGRIMFDQEIEQEIILSSPANDRITVSNIQLTAPLRARDIQTTIEPGENFQFTLALGRDRLFGEYEGLIKINFVEQGIEPIILSVEGYIVPPIELKPTTAFYVVTTEGKDKSASIEIINHREQPLNIKQATSNSDRFTTKLETVTAGKHYRLELLLDGNSPSGEQSEKITLETGEGKTGTMSIQANTIIREPVYTAPKTIDMGALPEKVAGDAIAVASLAQILMVYRPDTTDFEIEAFTDLDFVNIESERGPNGDRYQLTLTLIPEKVVPGKIEGLVMIKTNDNRIKTLEIPVSGHILN